MSSTFEHRIVYVGKTRAEAKRCSVCGSPPEIEWRNISMSPTFQRMYPGSLTCPNGPHEMDDQEYLAALYVDRAPPVPTTPDPGVTESNPNRRHWWRK